MNRLTAFVKFISLCLMALMVWTIILAAAAFWSKTGTPLFLIAPKPNAAAIAVASGGSLEDFGRYTAITRANTPGFIKSLYQNGAFLVLDVKIIAGCRGLKQKENQQQKLKNLTPL